MWKKAQDKPEPTAAGTTGWLLLNSLSTTAGPTLKHPGTRSKDYNQAGYSHTNTEAQNKFYGNFLCNKPLFSPQREKKSLYSIEQVKVCSKPIWIQKLSPAASIFSLPPVPHRSPVITHQLLNAKLQRLVGLCIYYIRKTPLCSGQSDRINIQKMLALWVTQAINSTFFYSPTVFFVLLNIVLFLQSPSSFYSTLRKQVKPFMHNTQDIWFWIHAITLLKLFDYYSGYYELIKIEEFLTKAFITEPPGQLLCSQNNLNLSELSGKGITASVKKSFCNYHLYFSPRLLHLMDFPRIWIQN